MSYSYDPSNITDYGKDRMRFELGDTVVDNDGESAALTDEEYTAIIKLYPGKWKLAKLKLLENLCRKFAFESSDTKLGSFSLSQSSRADFWRADYEALKKEVEAASVSFPSTFGTDGCKSHPYFRSGMMQNFDSK